MTASAEVARVFREEQGRILASLIGSVRDFELAEEALMDAYERALETWPVRGVPNNPAAWITRTARNRAIDRVRRRSNWRDKEPVLAHLLSLRAEEKQEKEGTVAEVIPDERLRLVFTCCHPALSAEARVALTLRTLGGLTTPEIARAFLLPEPTLAQRLVRAKRKIRDAGIPYRVPPPELLGERLQSVLSVVYLVFNEGYSASAGSAVVRRDLCAEAIRLARLLVELMPSEPESVGLLALMLLHDSRRAAREDAEGVPILMAEQDRGQWDRLQIVEGLELVERALRMGRVGPYQLQAAVSALHARATTAEETDWPQIAALYGVLESMNPSAVVRLNRAVAIALAGDVLEGLRRMDLLVEEGRLTDYVMLPSARAELLRRLGRWQEARDAYDQAIDLCANAGHRTLLVRKRAAISAAQLA
ncbi:MAG: RNA polymerase sigma factor [Deltaproteobacteria bacterium]|nr:RNA polymerase sigma factor [Deltaproteobacteria bacterium]